VNNEEITEYVDIAAPPPGPSAHILFGTNQSTPVEIAANLYHQGSAPLIIATGGINRHNGIVEGREFRRMLLERGVPKEAIRVEDTSTDTWENVEYSLAHLREAVERGLAITAVSKWYHLRAIYALRAFLPGVNVFYARSWDPIYNGEPVTRQNWPSNVAGHRRVIREWEEVSRRIHEGDLIPVIRDDGWR
jgi:uncharacterized SAM-binding protein YcdF (DUF218 family)